MSREFTDTPHATRPAQDPRLGWRVQVYFPDTDAPLPGTIVRYDREHPWITIIHLDDGRYLLSTEYAYALAI